MTDQRNDEERDRTCGTCSHWQQPSGDRDEPYQHEPRPEGPTPWGWCGLIGLPEYGEVVTTTAYTKDGSDYVADLHTRSDFGCNLHDPAPSGDVQSQAGGA